MNSIQIENEIRQLTSNTYKIKKTISECCVDIAFEENTIIIHEVEMYNIPSSIEILKNKQFDLRLLNTELFHIAPTLLDDLFHFKKYNECKKILENKINKLDETFLDSKFKDERATILNHEQDINKYNGQIDTINIIIGAVEEFRNLLFLAIPNLEIEFNRLLSDYNLQNNNTIKDVISLPTWAGKTEIEQSWSELLGLKMVDAKDKNNFHLAFGHGDKSKPYEKFSLGTSATNLMVFLILMIDRTSKTLSTSNRLIANDLFTIQLNTTTKPNKNDIETWSNKLQNTIKNRKSTTEYQDDYEPTIE